MRASFWDTGLGCLLDIQQRGKWLEAYTSSGAGLGSEMDI